MLLLHFSDTHGIRRAVHAVCNVASKWKTANIAITGDVCRLDAIASPEFDEFSNPATWLVNGNHDGIPAAKFGHLKRVKWQKPYIADLSKYATIIGLDSEQESSRSSLENQLQSLSLTDNFEQKTALVVLHHRPYTHTKAHILVWAKQHFPRIKHVALLHGHEHHLLDFYAKTIVEQYEDIAVVTSNVYSANSTFFKGKTRGCANLFIIRDDGSIVVETVFDY